MAKKPRSLRRKAYYTMKIKKAAHLLFYKHHVKPGVKGWELRNMLGADYMKIIDLLNDYLEKLDLQVKVLFNGTEKPKDEAGSLSKARFLITLKGTLTPKEAKMIGWRIDDIAGLAASIAYIISKGGKAPRREIEDLLKDKLPGWRVDANINRYIRSGYLTEDEKENLYLDWRTTAEVDRKALINLIMGAGREQQ